MAHSFRSNFSLYIRHNVRLDVYPWGERGQLCSASANQRRATHFDPLSHASSIVVATKVERVRNATRCARRVGKGRQSQLRRSVNPARRDEGCYSLEGDVGRVLDTTEELVAGSPGVDGDVGERVDALVARNGEDTFVSGGEGEEEEGGGEEQKEIRELMRA